jgi:hypothetical protein
MPKAKKAAATGSKPKKAKNLKYVTVSNPSYGQGLKGVRIYYEGEKPTSLRDDGRISFGKNILETLRKHFGNSVRWIISISEDSIEEHPQGVWVRTSRAMLKRMYSENFERSRDVKNEIVQRRFFTAFPSYFKTAPPSPYYPGTLSKILTVDSIKKFTAADKDAITKLLPAFMKSEGMSSLAIKAVEIDSLKALAQDFRVELQATHAESWWQDYIKGRILIMQQGYIRAIEKMNVAIGNTKYPDFSLVTHDNYLDILEIKKPDTSILKEDLSRGNFHWDIEISRAVIQVENYLEHISNHAADVRSFLKDKYNIDLKVVRPRGFILAGNTSEFADQKQRDDFRLLSYGLKNVTVITYDELLTRLDNHIKVLEQFQAAVPTDPKKKKKAK